MYVHLNTHSAYSLQEGLALPGELVQAASSCGMTALGLTDHNLLSGTIEFVQACREAGIQPVLGLEIDLEAGGSLPLLAQSMTGWANLCRISSALALRDSPEAPCPNDILAAYSSDLISLIPWETSDSNLGSLKEIFPGRSYLSLRDPARGLPASNRARKFGLPLVANHPVWYLTQEQAELQRTVSAIRLIQPRDTLTPDALAPAGSHFLTAREVEARFRHFPAAVAATAEIAERCKFDLPIGVAHMPTVPLPAGKNATQVLTEKALAGARKLYGEITPEIQSRLEHEINVIARMGFEPIFLIVEELLNYARQEGIPYSSRGSAASSLVAHCLGITSPDPLRLNLYFERFLNPARTTPPDIDTDLCSERRADVIQHVFDTFGQERVAMVATINHFRPRSALGDVAKAHGLEQNKIRDMVNKLPYSFWARFEENDNDGLPSSPFSELRSAHPAAEYQRMFDDAEAILKLPRHLSVHPGGVIVSPGPLTDLVPVMRSGSKGIIITQFDLDAVEALGLVKIDLLGIKGLTVLGDVAEFVQNGEPERYSTRLAVLDSTPAEDPETADRIENGQTIGCFQIESPGMRATLREIHARSEDDLMAALALYRPGPLTGGLKDAFVRRYKGQEHVQHLHPSLAPLLDETFGVILYQEQVLRIANEIAGFSLADADLLRRAMSHFDPGKRMQELQAKFVNEAYAQSGMPYEIGERLWEMMAAFAGYGFPKAHAASYASIGWRSAWCKTHFPAEFMAAVLANWGGYYSQRVYLSEARRMGLVVRPPHVNHSGSNFVVCRDPKALYMGLGQVKDLTHRTIERIINGRPFSSLEDFLARADPRAKEARNLACAGALDGLGAIPAILRRLDEGSWRAGQLAMFGWIDQETRDWSLAEKVKAQQEILGLSVEAHPLEMVIDKVTAAKAITTIDAAGRVGQRVRVAGIRQTSHRSRTARGEPMMFLTMEDLSGMLDVVFFPDVYQQAKNIVGGNDPFLVMGEMEMDASRGEPFLRAERISRLD